jgi:multimeric flavodoxin WrbA
MEAMAYAAAEAAKEAGATVHVKRVPELESHLGNEVGRQRLRNRNH